MSRPELLPYISNEQLYKHTGQLVHAAQQAAITVRKNPYKNVIDPFSALVDAARQGIPTDKWMEQEIARQTQKSFQNALGEFHQHILGAMPGWVDAGAGGSYDVLNKDLGVIAEIKNKHNTMNAPSALSVYDNLAGHIDYNKFKKAYVVEIVPKSAAPYEKPWAPSSKGVKRVIRQNLVKIDGESFYALASGDTDALKKLYDTLPIVLADLLEVEPGELTGTPYFKELFSRVYGS